MRTLVTGGTGFLGGNLVQHLLSHGAPVRVLTRSMTKARPLVAQGVEMIEGEVTDRRALTKAMQGVEVVYHLAGRLFVQGIPVEEYYRTHVEGTRSLLECCDKGSLKRLVHCSTTGVLGVTGNQPADEETQPAPTNVYEATKWEAEQLVRAAIECGLPAAIVRPGLVYGPGDLHLLGFFQSIRRGLFRPIGERPVWLHPVYVSDLAEALWRCAQDPHAIGECFHIAGREPVTMATLAATIATSLGVDPPHGTIPMPAARALAAAGDMLPAGLKRLAPLTSSRLEFLTNSRVYDVHKAQQLLGFVAQTDLSAGIARTVDWYRYQRYLPGASRLASLEKVA